MHQLIECSIIGIIATIIYVVSLKLIDKQKPINKMWMIISFICGATLHYIINKTRMTDIYCHKICYGDNCLYVCHV